MTHDVDRPGTTINVGEGKRGWGAASVSDHDRPPAIRGGHSVGLRRPCWFRATVPPVRPTTPTFLGRDPEGRGVDSTRPRTGSSARVPRRAPYARPSDSPTSQRAVSCQNPILPRAGASVQLDRRSQGCPSVVSCCLEGRSKDRRGRPRRGRGAHAGDRWIRREPGIVERKSPGSRGALPTARSPPMEGLAREQHRMGSSRPRRS
jgi:hypothetical protein